MKEKDKSDKQKSPDQLLLKLQKAENCVISEGTVSADKSEK